MRHRDRLFLQHVARRAAELRARKSDVRAAALSLHEAVYVARCRGQFGWNRVAYEVVEARTRSEVRRATQKLRTSHLRYLRESGRPPCPGRPRAAPMPTKVRITTTKSTRR